MRTDDPDHRFRPGTVLATEPADRGPLTLESVKWHSGTLLLRIEGVADRQAADELRNTLLVVEVADLPELEDDSFYDHQLVGLTVQLTDGTVVGTGLGGPARRRRAARRAAPGHPRPAGALRARHRPDRGRRRRPPRAHAPEGLLEL